MYFSQGIPAARVEEWMKLLPDNKVPKLGGPGETYRENQLRHQVIYFHGFLFKSLQWNYKYVKCILSNMYIVVKFINFLIEMT